MFNRMDLVWFALLLFIVKYPGLEARNLAKFGERHWHRTAIALGREPSPSPSGNWEGMLLMIEEWMLQRCKGGTFRAIKTRMILGNHTCNGRTRLAVWFLLAFCFFAPSVFGQIIPADRLVPWQGNVGIPGGIPNRATIYQTISAGASQSTIQSALNACPANQVVKLSAGSYTLTGTLTVPSNVTLRGAGIGQTMLNATSGTAVCTRYFQLLGLMPEIRPVSQQPCIRAIPV